MSFLKNMKWLKEKQPERIKNTVVGVTVNPIYGKSVKSMKQNGGSSLKHVGRSLYSKETDPREGDVNG